MRLALPSGSRPRHPRRPDTVAPARAYARHPQMPITLERRGATTTLSMAMPRGNAINFAFIEAVNAVLDELERSPPGALVIVSQGKAFCGGLDLIEAYDYDRATLRGFVDAFEGMFLRLFTLGRPVV